MKFRTIILISIYFLLAVNIVNTDSILSVSAEGEGTFSTNSQETISLVREIMLDDDNNLYIAGQTASGNCHLSKYSDSGEKLWSITFGGSSEDTLDSAVLSQNQNIILNL